MHTPAITLFIDLASSTQLFAVVSDERIVAQQRVENARAEEKLVPTLEALLESAGIELAGDMHRRLTLNRIAVILGPGGFMSLRVGVAMANALSYALKIPSAGIHLSDLWKARLEAHSSKLIAPLVWLHSTRKHQLFIRGCGEFAERWPAPQLIDLEDLKRALSNEVRYVGELISEHIEAVAPRIAFKALQPMDAVLPTLLASLPYQSNQTLLPWYGREG